MLSTLGDKNNITSSKSRSNFEIFIIRSFCIVQQISQRTLIKIENNAKYIFSDDDVIWSSIVPLRLKLKTNCRHPGWQYYVSHVSSMSHYGDVIMGAIASQITSLTIVYSIVYSDADQSKHQSSASLAFVWAIHRGLVNSPHKWPVTRKLFPIDDVIMLTFCFLWGRFLGTRVIM